MANSRRKSQAMFDQSAVLVYHAPRHALASILVSAGSRLAADRAAAEIARLVIQLLLDAQELIILRRTVRAGERAGFDLPAIGGDREVGDGCILRLART